MVYKQVVRRALFGMHGGDAERVHETTLNVMARLSPLAKFARNQNNPRTVFGIRFPNPVGLAAGLDKDGRALPAWAALGFGFVEVGTVTWHAQPGNPKPRLFRLQRDEAIINRMGFNNAGARKRRREARQDAAQGAARASASASPRSRRSRTRSRTT